MSKEITIFERVNHLVSDSAQQYASIVAQYSWSLVPTSQLNAAMQLLMQNDYITNVALSQPESVQSALIQSATLGLDLTPGKRQGWLVPRKSPRKDEKGKYPTIIVLQVGYKGVEAIAQKIGTIDRLSIRVVRQNDTFKWEGDDSVKPEHNAQWFAPESERGPIVGAYSVTYFPDKSIHVITSSIEKIHKDHRDRSDSWKSFQQKKAKGEKAYPPPWVTDEQSMVEKTMAFIASKQWPANIRNSEVNSKILETLHEVDTQDYSFAKFTAEQKEFFDDCLENGDGLGIYLVSISNQDTYQALFKTLSGLPRGQITKAKDKARELETQGLNTFTAAVGCIQENDQGGLMELIEDCSDITLKMFRRCLNPSELAMYEEMTNGS